MFDLFRKSGARTPSAAMHRALEQDGLPSGTDATAALRVVESRGSYSGRKVTFVRIFDPSRAAERGADVRAYGDLDSHPDLVLWAGRVEKDGAVAITRQAAPPAVAPSERQRADRAAHADDEHLVSRPADR